MKDYANKDWLAHPVSDTADMFSACVAGVAIACIVCIPVAYLALELSK